jgi:uncharacterized phosphatase
MTLIYIVRHGQTEWNASGNKYCGISDIELSETGKRQALKVASVLKDVEFSAAYSSSLCRAHETASLIAKEHGLTVTPDPRIIEMNYGTWEGKRREEFLSEWADWLEDPSNRNAGGTGETSQQVFDRYNEFIEEVAKKHRDETILVVAHSMANRVFIAGTLEMPYRNYGRLQQDNTGITVFQKDEKQTRFITINLNTHVQ